MAALSVRRRIMGAEDGAALVAEVIRHRTRRREILVAWPGLFRRRPGCRSAGKRNGGGAGLPGTGARGSVGRRSRRWQRSGGRRQRSQCLFELLDALAQLIPLLGELGIFGAQPIELILGLASADARPQWREG